MASRWFCTCVPLAFCRSTRAPCMSTLAMPITHQRRPFYWPGISELLCMCVCVCVCVCVCTWRRSWSLIRPKSVAFDAPPPTNPLSQSRAAPVDQLRSSVGRKEKTTDRSGAVASQTIRLLDARVCRQFDLRTAVASQQEDPPITAMDLH